MNAQEVDIILCVYVKGHIRMHECTNIAYSKTPFYRIRKIMRVTLTYYTAQSAYKL